MGQQLLLIIQKRSNTSGPFNNEKVIEHNFNESISNSIYINMQFLTY